MSQPVLMAVRGAVAMIAVSLPVAVLVAWRLGGAEAVSFGYGVLTGLLTFASIGVTVSLVLGRTNQLRVLLGAGIYAGRIVFAAAAVLVPVFSGWFPVLPMIGGLVLVYVVESVVLLFEAQRFTSREVGKFASAVDGAKKEDMEAEDVEVSVRDMAERRAV